MRRWPRPSVFWRATSSRGVSSDSARPVPTTGAAAGVDQGIQTRRSGHPVSARKSRVAGMVWTFVRSMVVLVITYKRAGQGILQPLDRLRESASGTHHSVVDLGVTRFERDLDVVQPGLDQLLHIMRVRQAAGIGVETGDLSVLLGMGDELGQVFAQGRLAAGEDDVRDAQFPGFVEDLLPVLRWKVRSARLQRLPPRPAPRRLAGKGARRCSSGRSRCCSGRSAPGPGGRARWDGPRRA